jgi:hypothetical protein
MFAEKFSLDALRTESAHRVLQPTVVLLIAGLIIALAISAAIRRGMDHAVTIGPGEQTAIAIALSESVYGVKLGYIGLLEVFHTIQEHWNQGANGWADLETLKANFHNADILNAGIKAAASLGPQQIGYISNGGLITTIYDDMGHVDFVSFAFRLFGLKIQSLFYLYFTLICLSTIVFILTFRDNILALGVLLCTLLAYYIEIYLAAFDPVAVPTFFGMRHSSTLGLVPMWFFTFLLLTRRRPSLGVIVGALIQLGVLVLAFRIRGSVTWMFLFLFILAFALAFQEVWSHQGRKPWFQIRWGSAFDSWSRPQREHAAALNPWSMLVASTLRWPVLLLIGGMLANGAYNRVSLHPVYFTDDIMPHHGIWYVAYLGLATYDPDILSPRIVKLINDHGLGVAFGSPAEGWFATRDYMDRIHLLPWSGKLDMSEPAPGLISAWPGIGMKQRLHDQLIQRAFFDVVREHPFRVFKVYAFTKPLWLADTAAYAFKHAPTRKWMWLVLAGGIGLCALFVAFARKRDVQALRSVFVTSAAVALAAFVPNLWAYHNVSIMADSILSIVTFMTVALGLGTFALLSYWRSRSRTDGVYARQSVE